MSSLHHGTLDFGISTALAGLPRSPLASAIDLFCSHEDGLVNLRFEILCCHIANKRGATPTGVHNLRICRQTQGPAGHFPMAG